MNNRSIINTAGPSSENTWLDAYMLPEPGHAQRQVGEGQLIDLARIRAIAWRQRWVFAIVLVTALCAGLIVTLLSTPMYEAQASIRVEPYTRSIVEGQDADQGIASNQVYDYLQTQIAVIESRNMAKVVATNLELGERAGFLPSDFDASRPPSFSDERWQQTKLDRAAALIHGSVSASLPDDNWVIVVSYQSSDPVEAAELANGFADAFASSDTRALLDNNEYAREYLQEQIVQVRSRLDDAERAANTYARNTEIIAQPGGEPGGAPATLTSANLARINSEVVEARSKRIAAEQRWLALQNLPAAQVPEVQNNGSIQALISERTRKRTQLVELRQRYNDDFPQIRELNEQISILTAQIEQSGSEVKAIVRNDYVVALNQEQALEAELANLTSATLEEKDDQVQLSVLEREAEALRGELEALLFRYNQISSAANIESSAFTKLDSAVVPGSPYAPSLLENMGLALVLGFAAAAGLAVLRETLDDRVRSLDEVEPKVGLPLIGHTPHVDDNELSEEPSSNFTALMESYASIRAAIEFSLPRDCAVLQLTSTRESEGKSTTAVILAELFARTGRKALLVDLDLRRPSVATLLDLEKPKAGLIEVAYGHSSLADAVFKGIHENLDVLPIAATPPNPSEFLVSKEFNDLVASIREEYSLIIFDSCPVLGLADAPIISRSVDGTIFVLEANRVPFAQARQAIKRLKGAGGDNLIGVILTKYRALEAGQSYGYGYDYYRYGEKS